jgi:hypothetical protein
MEIVTTPTERWLSERLARCQRHFIVSSPYVGRAFADLLAHVSGRARKVLLTRVDLRDFAFGSSDIEALCAIARQGTVVTSLAALHAKVYVVDDTAALVTSANATQAGLLSNLECGLAAEDPDVVRRLGRLVLSGFGATESPAVWRYSDLEPWVPVVEMLKEPVRKALAGASGDLAKVMLRLPSAPSTNAALTAVKGWTSLVLRGILLQPRDTFRLDELDATCRPAAAKRYPRNRHVREKLRQQLQRLRDLGLVEFLGQGRYRRTVEIE